MSENHCVHHWVIDTPDGKTSWGQCRACLASITAWREFPNTMSDQAWDWMGVNTLEWEARQRRSAR